MIDNYTHINTNTRKMIEGGEAPQMQDISNSFLNNENFNLSLTNSINNITIIDQLKKSKIQLIDESKQNLILKD